MAEDRKHSTLTIRILGRDYPITCPDEEREALLSSAQYLSRRMQAIQKKGKTLGIDRIAVMAALNTARELLTLQQEIAQLRAQIDNNAEPANTADTVDWPYERRAVDDRLTQLQLRIETALDEPA